MQIDDFDCCIFETALKCPQLINKCKMLRFILIPDMMSHFGLTSSILSKCLVRLKVLSDPLPVNIEDSLYTFITVPLLYTILTLTQDRFSQSHFFQSSVQIKDRRFHLLKSFFSICQYECVNKIYEYHQPIYLQNI